VTKSPTILSYCFIFLLFVACQQQKTEQVQQTDNTPQTVPQSSGIIRIGSISKVVKDEVSDFQPLADYLAQHLTDHDIGHGKVVVKQSLSEMAEAISKGEIDLYVDSPLPILLLNKRTGIKPLLRRWKKGRESYHTVFFVHKDSPIQTLQDLKGHLVAFDDPYSTTGYLLPKATMIQAGLTLQNFKSFENKPPPDTVGYLFSNDDENTLFWVFKKRVEAGVIDDDNFNKLGRSQLSSFRIIHRTIDIPRHVVAHHKDLNPHLITPMAHLQTSICYYLWLKPI